MEYLLICNFCKINTFINECFIIFSCGHNYCQKCYEKNKKTNAITILITILTFLLKVFTKPKNINRNKKRKIIAIAKIIQHKKKKLRKRIQLFQQKINNKNAQITIKKHIMKKQTNNNTKYNQTRHISSLSNIIIYTNKK